MAKEKEKIVDLPRARVVRRRHQKIFTKPSMAKQSFRDECDINNVLKKYNKTGQLPDLIKQNPQYGDFSEAPDYQDALNLVILAEQQFNALPAHARKRFNNDPAEFLAFVHNSDNAEEMVSLGLATKRPVDDPKASDPSLKEDPKSQPAGGPITP